MIDNINSNYPVQGPGGVKGSKPSQQTSPATPSARPGGSQADEVSISESGRVMQKALNAVKQAPDVRIDLVNNIKTSLSNGTYQVNPEALANKMLPLFA